MAVGVWFALRGRVPLWLLVILTVVLAPAGGLLLPAVFGTFYASRRWLIGRGRTETPLSASGRYDVPAFVLGVPSTASRIGSAPVRNGSAVGSPVSTATLSTKVRASSFERPLVLALTATTGAGLTRAATSS